MTRFIADLLMLVAAAIWGLAFVFQKTAMDHLGPLTFIAARGAIAALTLVPLAIAEGHWQRQRITPAEVAVRQVGTARTAAIAGVAFFVAAALQQYGLQTATASNAGFLTALYVVVTPIAAWLMKAVKPTLVLVPAVTMSALGTWMLGGGTVSALTTGDWLVVACAFFWALHVIQSETGATFGRPILFTCLQFAVVALLGALGAATFEKPTLSNLLAAADSILYVGVLSSALTFSILTWALKYASASEAAVIVSTECLFAAVAGALLLGERLQPIAIVGAAVIMLAVLLVQLGPHLRKGRGRDSKAGAAGAKVT